MRGRCGKSAGSRLDGEAVRIRPCRIELWGARCFGKLFSIAVPSRVREAVGKVGSGCTRRGAGTGGGKGRSAESCIFSGARHAAHHRNVSTRPEIKCLSNDTGGSQPASNGFRLCQRK